MDQGITPEQALQLAVNRIGSQAAMARLCEVTQPAVFKWLNESKQLPAEHVLKVELATGVSRCDLRPDIYPRGLQDGTPFHPAGRNLGDEAAPVPDDRSGFLQRTGTDS
ncbi:MAG: transcriptional regulator [Bacillota bacterium]